MSSRSIFLTYLYSFSILLHQATAQSALAFDNYPAAAKPCLTSAATQSQCNAAVVADFNKCVCSNGGNFVTNTVKCLSSSDAGDLAAVYGTMSSNCADSNTPLPYTLAQFLALGGSTTTTKQTSTTTVTGVTTVSGSTKQTTFTSVVTTATSNAVTTIVITPTGSQTAPLTTVLTLGGGQASPTNTSHSSGGGGSKLSTGAIIGIGVGVGVPICLAIISLIGAICWKQRRKEKRTSAAFASPAPTAPTLYSDRPASSVTTFNNPPGGAAYSSYDPKMQQSRFSNMSYTNPVVAGTSSVGQTRFNTQQGYSPGQGYVEPYGAPVELPAQGQQEVQELPGTQPGGHGGNQYPYSGQGQQHGGGGWK